LLMYANVLHPFRPSSTRLFTEPGHLPVED
jgi:hypothetical protein